MLSQSQKIKMAEESPARLYLMLLEEKAKAEVEYISKAAQDFMNAIKESIEEQIDYYQEEYGKNWEEVMEADWNDLYPEIIEGKSELLREYFRNLL